MSYSSFSNGIMEMRYSHIKPDGTKETWREIAERVVNSVMGVIPISQGYKSELIHVIDERKFIPGGRFLAQAGRPYHQTSNCFMLRAEDTREGWGDLMRKATVMLMSGGGIGVDYSDIRPKGAVLKRSGGTSSGVLPLANVVNEIGRGVMAGGNRRSAIYASLRWSHADVMDFIRMKDWPDYIIKQKAIDFDTPAKMDMTNMSVILDREFFEAYGDPAHPKHSWAQEVYWAVVNNMVKTAEPGLQIDYNNASESLRNACTEVVSEDDSDVCVLGSINLGRIKDLAELKSVTELGQLFLLAGTEYTDRPTEEVKKVQEKNRRTGLGLMGMHHWLIARGKPYGRDEELATWLQAWKDASRQSADQFTERLGWARPVATRAIAPNGSISIAGGRTTSGIEPIFAVAYKRRFLSPEGWKHQFVVDPVAEQLIEEGSRPDKIEDAYSLSMDVERRVDFQSFVQEYVDNAISSTINLPQYGTPGNDDPRAFGEMLYKHLPSLRGVTCYPDSARSGQPITTVPYEYAMKHKNKVFESKEECVGGVCGL
jgi:ribonucleoside-diphosphate reductase alpha chain